VDDVPDSWSMAHISGERPALLRINAPLKDFARKAQFPVSAIFSIPLADLQEGWDTAHGFEERLFSEAQEAGRGVVAAVVTSAETRDFIVFVGTLESANAVQQTLSRAFPGLRIYLSAETDSAWRLFDRLLPPPATPADAPPP